MSSKNPPWNAGWPGFRGAAKLKMCVEAFNPHLNFLTGLSQFKTDSGSEHERSVLHSVPAFGKHAG